MTARWSSLLLLLFLLLCLLTTSVKASFILTARFITYNNYLATNSTGDNDTLCCFNNCSPNACDTSFLFCFKKYGIETNISNDQAFGDECIKPTVRSGLLPDIVSIDYAMQEIKIKSLTLRDVKWPGRLQFFARMLVGSVVEYFVYDFELQAEDDPLNATINGTRNDSNVTFTVSLSLMCFPNFYGPNCSVECVPRSSDELGFYTCLSNGSRQCLPDYEGENCTIPIAATTTPSSSTPFPSSSASPSSPSSSTSPSSSSVVPLAAGVAGGIVLLLIILCVLALLLIVGLKRRLKAQTVDVTDSRDEKSPEGMSHGQTSGLGIMDNPMYEVGMRGTHLPLGKSPSVEMDVEHDVDNPLYMMEIEDVPLTDGVPPTHDYDDIVPQKAPPTVSAEGGVYDEPDVVLHSLPPAPPPPLSSSPPSHLYTEPDTRTHTTARAGSPPQRVLSNHATPLPPSAANTQSQPATLQPGPIYDAPLILNEQTPTLSFENNHYETADAVNQTSVTSQNIYDTDNEDY